MQGIFRVEDVRFYCRWISPFQMKWTRSRAYTSVLTIHSIPINSSFITSSPPSHSLISNSSHLCWTWKKDCLLSKVDFGGAVPRAANSRSIFEISRPWRCEMWRFGIPSVFLSSCKGSFSDCSGGRIDAGGGASQGAGCERGTRSWPSPQPTSRIYTHNKSLISYAFSGLFELTHTSDWFLAENA